MWNPQKYPTYCEYGAPDFNDDEDAYEMEYATESFTTENGATNYLNVFDDDGPDERIQTAKTQRNALVRPLGGFLDDSTDSFYPLSRPSLGEETSWEDYGGSDPLEDEDFLGGGDPQSLCEDFFDASPSDLDGVLEKYQVQERPKESQDFPPAAKKTTQIVNTSIGEGLRRVTEIPEKYRCVFLGIPCFNLIQSRVFDSVMYSNCPVVVAAPTGSGKTAVFEMAIVKLLRDIDADHHGWHDFKVVYMAPVKALCAERLADWSKKFGPLGLKCAEITGDMEQKYYSALRENQIILTTPEKWDSMTRQWKDNKGLVQHVKLILIDEVHLLNEDHRGPILEAVVSRMKTVALNLEQEGSTRIVGPKGIRFLAVSATIPNIGDISKWLNYGSPEPAKCFCIGDKQRPVPLTKIVYGYESRHGWSSFRFDMQLTYRLKDVLIKHSDGKPSLIFCSTRKSVTQTVTILTGGLTLGLTSAQKSAILSVKDKLFDKKMGEALLRGIGAHHAGIHKTDRLIVEDLFRNGNLPVLVSTSTLAMGVNLPAHLVVIKSTEQYVNGAYAEYSESSILQMMGRAGRPQFDTSATAVIMTKQSQKLKYEKMVGGKQLVESSLHCHLAEHLNAEVVLQTITDLSLAMSWLKSTFLYVRAVKCPKNYKFSTSNVEGQLKDLCLREMQDLSNCGIVEMDGMDVVPTEAGKIMAKYYICLSTMKIFMDQIKEGASLDDLLKVMCKCSEFSDHQLRVNEKRTLNELNKKIKFKLQGKVQSRESKIYVLLQAILGCLQFLDVSLHQESFKLMRVVKRIAKCMLEFINSKIPKDYSAMLNAILLAKCVEKSLWPDSEFVARQLDGIGAKYAENLVAAGKNSFRAIKDSNPRDLERIMGVTTSRGNIYVNACSRLPDYVVDLSFTKVKGDMLRLQASCALANTEDLQIGKTAGQRHSTFFMLADKTSNKIIYSEKILDSYLMKSSFTYSTVYQLPRIADECYEIVAHVVSESWVGIDKQTTVKVENPNKVELPVEPAEENTETKNPKAKPKKSSSQKVTKKTQAKPALKPAEEKPTKKKQPSVSTQTLEKYRLVKRIPLMKFQKQEKKPVAVAPKVEPVKVKETTAESQLKDFELDEMEWKQEPDQLRPLTPEPPSPCSSPSYSPIYSPASIKTISEPKSPPKKKRYILNYPLPVLNFEIELETDSEEEFEINPFTQDLPNLSLELHKTPKPPTQRCKRSLSPVKEASALVDTILLALGNSVTPKISTYLSSQGFSQITERPVHRSSALSACGFVLPRSVPAQGKIYKMPSMRQNPLF